MGLLALLNHAINFLAPALWLALLLPLAARIFIRKRPSAHTLKAQAALHFVVGGGILLVGLVVFGRDGKMLTYVALVLADAGVQFWLLRAWKA